MRTIVNILEYFFGVIVRPQTYLNTIYLLLAFPLGLFYFIFLVVGFSLGIALTIVWVGLLILLAVLGMWYVLIIFERQFAIWLLREDIPPISRKPAGANPGVWQSFSGTLTNRVTWTGLLYLFARFPLGIFSFVVVVTLIALSGALITAPLYYWWANPVIHWGWGGTWFNPIWVINSLPEALLATFVGIFVFLISLHIFNGLAWLYGKFAWMMLGSTANITSVAAPAPVPAPALVSATTLPAVPDEMPLSEAPSSQPTSNVSAVEETALEMAAPPAEPPLSEVGSSEPSGVETPGDDIVSGEAEPRSAEI